MAKKENHQIRKSACSCKEILIAGKMALRLQIYNFVLIAIILAWSSEPAVIESRKGSFL